MIVCKLELWPGGDSELAEHLGTIEIVNNIIDTLCSDGGRGTYSVRMFKKKTNRVFAKTIVRNFPRKSYHPWNIVRIALNMIAEANGGRI